MDDSLSIRLIARDVIEAAARRVKYGPGAAFADALEDLICDRFQKVTVWSEANIPEDIFIGHRDGVEQDMMEKAAHALAREILLNDKCRIAVESRKDKMRHVRKFKHTMTVVVVNEP